MKLCAIFLVVCAIGTFKCFPYKPESFELDEAFSEISDFLAKKDHLLSIVVGDYRNPSTDAVLSQVTEFPHAVACFKEDSKPFHLNSSAFVLLDSIDSLRNFNKQTILPYSFLMSQPIFVHVKNGTVEEIKKIQDEKEEVPLQYEYFLVEEADSVKLLTFVAFTTEKCHQRQLIEVNIFEKKIGKWLHDTFWIDKSSNFYGCTLDVVMQGGMPEFFPIKIDYRQKNIVECKGYVCAALKHISSKLNFTYRTNMHYMDKFTFPLTKVDLPLRYRQLSAAHTFRGYPRETQVVYTTPVYFKDHFIAIPPGEEYNGYEKLILPFDPQTWIWICITFASAFATIFVLKFMPLKLKHFVIGEFEQTAVLNVIRAFFGISQTIIPERNSARILLMAFILFSLIIRTAYQGVMFTFLQEDMRKPTVKSIDEMIANNFTFYMQGGFKSYYRDMDLVKRGNIVDNWNVNKLSKAYERLYIPGTKTAVFYHSDMYVIAIIKWLDRTVPPKLLPERYMLETRALFFPAHHVLYEAIDKKLQLLIAGGLIDYHLINYYDRESVARFTKFRESYKALTLKELEAGFVISLVPLVLSLLVFCIELLTAINYSSCFNKFLKFFKR